MARARSSGVLASEATRSGKRIRKAVSSRASNSTRSRLPRPKSRSSCEVGLSMGNAPRLPNSSRRLRITSSTRSRTWEASSCIAGVATSHLYEQFSVLPPEATTRRSRLPSTRAGSCSKNYGPGVTRGPLRAFLLRVPGGVAGWHERRREVHAGKVCSGQIRFAENGYSHIRAGEFRAVHVGQPQVNVSQVCAMENGVGEVAAEKFNSTGLGLRQIRAGENRFGHVRVSQIGVAKICAGQIRAGQPGLSQVRAFEVSAGQNGSAEIDALEIRPRKIGAGQIRPRASFLPAEKERVSLKNFRQPFSVVLNALDFSQSHSLRSTPSCNALFYSLSTSLTSASGPLVRSISLAALLPAGVCDSV